MEKELFGSEAPLDRNSPRDMRPEARTGTPAKEFFGSVAPLSHKPEGVTQFNAGTRSPFIEYGEASMVDLQKTPDKGWESYSTPMSDRAKKQSEKT